nr:MAG TPA: hypothetical protein [Caudoviricetes sp.]
MGRKYCIILQNLIKYNKTVYNTFTTKMPANGVNAFMNLTKV